MKSEDDTGIHSGSSESDHEVSGRAHGCREEKWEGWFISTFAKSNVEFKALKPHTKQAKKARVRGQITKAQIQFFFCGSW